MGRLAHVPTFRRFMSAFSKDMPDHDTLENNVTALVNNADVSSSISPLTEDGNDQTYKIDLDWLLEIRSLEPDGPLVRRREVVHCELRKEKKKWKIGCPEADRFLRTRQFRKIMTRCAALLMSAATLRQRATQPDAVAGQGRNGAGKPRNRPEPVRIALHRVLGAALRECSSLAGRNRSPGSPGSLIIQCDHASERVQQLGEDESYQLADHAAAGSSFPPRIRWAFCVASKHFDSSLSRPRKV